ncbi:MAG: hypothetical protein Kow0026_15060 [Oricola sp.]
MRFLLAAAALFGTVAANAGASPPAYMDDRSDAVALVRSYYNALSRKEFARAWNYRGERKPAADFATFEAKYRDIATAELAFGPVSAEGAAGSWYYRLPVAVRVTREDGSEDQSAGCIVARLANPQIQGVPFRPMHIVSDTLAAASGPLEDSLPASCRDD